MCIFLIKFIFIEEKLNTLLLDIYQFGDTMGLTLHQRTQKYKLSQNLNIHTKLRN